MTVAFDGDIFAMQARGGISRYYCDLATALQELSVSVTVYAGFHSNANVRQVPRAFGVRVPPAGRLVPLRTAANRSIEVFATKLFPPDILHRTFFRRNGWRSRCAKIVVTVHDMIPEHFGERMQNSDKRLTCEHADAIIAVSENTKKDLIDFYQVDPRKIAVVHHGCPTLSDNGKQSIPDTPYLLFVGNRGWYKNFNNLLRAYAQSKPITGSFDLVSFGGPPFNREEHLLIAQLGLSAKVHHRTGDDNCLASHYKNAAALVFPSTHEGFGFPPIEAMSLGCPVVCSNTSCLPEIVGDCGEYFVPTSIDDITRAIQRVLFSAEYSADLRIRGLLRSRRFTWENCAASTLAVYSALTRARD